MTTKTKHPRATEGQFTATRFHTSKDKALTVNAAVRFLETGLDPAKFVTNKRAYHFFHQTLSMSAKYDIHGFAAYHFENDLTKARFLSEVRHLILQHTNLDTERNSDMAVLFAPAYSNGSTEHGIYADLLDWPETGREW